MGFLLLPRYLTKLLEKTIFLVSAFAQYMLGVSNNNSGQYSLTHILPLFLSLADTRIYIHPQTHLFSRADTLYVVYKHAHP